MKLQSVYVDEISEYVLCFDYHFIWPHNRLLESVTMIDNVEFKPL